jgi:hypothetical protein
MNSFLRELRRAACRFNPEPDDHQGGNVGSGVIGVTSRRTALRRDISDGFSRKAEAEKLDTLGRDPTLGTTASSHGGAAMTRFNRREEKFDTFALPKESRSGGVYKTLHHLMRQAKIMTAEYAKGVIKGLVPVPSSHGRSPWPAPYDGLARTKCHVGRLVERVEQSL